MVLIVKLQTVSSLIHCGVSASGVAASAERITDYGADKQDVMQTTAGHNEN